MDMVLKKFMVFFVAAALMFIPVGSGVMAQDRLDEEKISPDLGMAGDILFVRPLGIVGTAVGSVLFVLSIPFSAAGGNMKQAFRKMVVDPAEYTFKRPLGDFSPNTPSP